jgi:hypothetical protein
MFIHISLQTQERCADLALCLHQTQRGSVQSRPCLHAEAKKVGGPGDRLHAQAGPEREASYSVECYRKGITCDVCKYKRCQLAA